MFSSPLTPCLQFIQGTFSISPSQGHPCVLPHMCSSRAVDCNIQGFFSFLCPVSCLSDPARVAPCQGPAHHTAGKLAYQACPHFIKEREDVPCSTGHAYGGHSALERTRYLFSCKEWRNKLCNCPWLVWSGILERSKTMMS